jgi:hypothetical protein
MCLGDGFVFSFRLEFKLWISDISHQIERIPYVKEGLQLHVSFSQMCSVFDQYFLDGSWTRKRRKKESRN